MYSRKAVAVMVSPSSTEDSSPEEVSPASSELPTDPSPSAPLPRPMSKRLRDWLRVLHHDPSAEERAMKERRQRLLLDLSRAAADSSDEIPLFEKLERLNHHHDD